MKQKDKLKQIEKNLFGFNVFYKLIQRFKG